MYILMLCAHCLIDLNTGYPILQQEQKKKQDLKSLTKRLIIFKHVLYKNVEHGVVFNKIMHFIIVILLRL